MEWHLITGEYPPEPGGVADYTSELARGLSDAGHKPHVWCRGDADAAVIEPGGVTVHRVAGPFGAAGLMRLGRELDHFPRPRTILIQYSPPAFGFKAMNLGFAAWAWARRAREGDDVRVMFHEVAFPWVGRPLRHNLLAAANRAMAALLVRSCSCAYVSIPAWEAMLRGLGAGRLPISWTPVPSNIPDQAPSEDVARWRVEAAGGCSKAPVVGHFGTYGSSIARELAPALRDLLARRPDVHLMLLGAGGERWAKQLTADEPGWSGRVFAPGSLGPREVAACLRACDLMIQPYPDGVSSRRGSTMAALANGVPVVTTIGRLSEPIWEQSGAVAASADVGRLVDLAVGLLASHERRAELGRAGRRMYDERFALRHTIAALLAT